MATALAQRTDRELTIDREFADRCRKLTIQERAKLEASLDKHGCLDPIICWANHDDTVIDGHHRYEICRTLGIAFKVKHLTFASREEVIQFIDEHQEGRRNESEKEQAYRRGRKYRDEKKAEGGRADRDVSGGNGCHPKTSERLAAEAGVSEKTVRNDAAFSAAVDELHPDVVPDALSDNSGLTRKDVKKLATLPKPEQSKAADGIKQKRKAKSTGAPMKTKRKEATWPQMLRWAASKKKPVTKEQLHEQFDYSIDRIRQWLAEANQSRGYIVSDVGDGRFRVSRAVHFALDLSDDDAGDLRSAMKRLVELADEYRAAKSATRCGKWTTDEEVQFISQVDSIAKRFLQG